MWKVLWKVSWKLLWRRRCFGSTCGATPAATCHCSSLPRNPPSGLATSSSSRSSVRRRQLQLSFCRSDVPQMNIIETTCTWQQLLLCACIDLGNRCSREICTRCLLRICWLSFVLWFHAFRNGAKQAIGLLLARGHNRVGRGRQRLD